jgi:hypothetical protein
MLLYALIVFGIAALGGLVLANSVLRGQFAPWAVSLLHAALGATGLVLLLVTVMNGSKQSATIALLVLLVAALLGFFLASFHARKLIPAKGLVFVHAGVAVTGFAVLAGAALNAI